MNLGGRLHARDADAQLVEAWLACNIISRMAELGMPVSYAVRMSMGASTAAVCRELDSCTNAARASSLAKCLSRRPRVRCLVLGNGCSSSTALPAEPVAPQFCRERAPRQDLDSVNDTSALFVAHEQVAL